MFIPPTLPRQERLKSRKLIQKVFDRNSPSVSAYPLRAVLYRSSEEGEHLPQILITVPKRNFKKAVDRNRIKRWIREAYRLQKTPFPGTTSLAFLYVGKEQTSFVQVERLMQQVLNKLKSV